MYTVTNSVLTVLPMGQGACNLIEIYGRDSNNTNDPEKLIYLGMVDCGGGAEKDENLEQSFEYAWRKMYERGKARGNDEPYIDMVILTHRDDDHHDKIPMLDNYLSNNVISVQKRGVIIDSFITPSTIRKKIQSKTNLVKYIKQRKGQYIYADFFEKGKIAYYLKCHAKERIGIQKLKKGYKLLDKKGAKPLSLDNILKEVSTIAPKMKDDLETIMKDASLSYNNISAEIDRHHLKNAVVGTFYYGGNDETKKFNNFNVTASVSGRLPADKNGKEIELKDIENAVIRFLCLLDTSIKGISGVDRSPENRASIVSLWDTGKGKYLMTGDATAETMAHLNNISDKTKYVDANVMTAPHHGADLTSRGYFKTKGVDVDNKWQIYSGFLSNYKPQGVAISAGYSNEHGHPGRNFLDVTYCYFKNNNKVNETEHSIYANLDDTVKSSKRCYGLYKTKAPIYSILQKNDAGNLCFRALQYSDSSYTPVDGNWSNQCTQAPSAVYDSSTTDCKNIKTKQSPFDYRKSNKNSGKSPAAAADLPRAVKRGRAG